MGTKTVTVKVSFSCSNHSVTEDTSIGIATFSYHYSGRFNIDALDKEVLHRYPTALVCKKCNQNQFNRLRYSFTHTRFLKGYKN